MERHGEGDSLYEESRIVPNTKSASKSMVFYNDIFIPQGLYGIIGLPLGHSLSPLVHNWGFKTLGLDFAYFRWPLEASRMADFLLAVRTLPISGLSVTIPHKRSILPYLDGCTNQALRAGAVNTLYWKDGQLWGENTDIQGFLSPLDVNVLKFTKKVLVLGNGGAARAVLVGLAGIHIRDVAVSGRDQVRTAALAEEFGARCLNWEERGQWRGDLLVNTTPLGMAGVYETLSPWPEDAPMDGIKLLYDLVYSPRETKLMLRGKASNVPCISGLEMFLGQACAQFSLWTNKTLPLAQLRNLVAGHLEFSLP